MKRGFDVLRDKTLNRSIVFGRKERDRLGLRGLLPHSVATQRQMVDRVMANLERLPRDIDRYMLLSSLQERNERLFYRTVIDHVERILPLIYTPTVGEACREFSHIAREPKGFFITPDDRGKIRRILANWPRKDIQVIVVTDGQRILGLGDLGANGMGIPVGKLALYTACAGIPPEACLPVTLDVGTNNEELLNDVLYLGYPHKRLEGKAYFDLVDEFVSAVHGRYPEALIQFEDFLTPNAYALLNKYRHRVLCFNDDIQGTAAVTLAGVYSSTRITGLRFRDLNIMFLGAGSAATGIADLMTAAFVDEGLSPEDARRHLWFVDVNGLVVKGRADLMEHNLPYAHDVKPLGFVDAIDAIRPHILIGATGAPGTFTRTVVERMSRINDRPGDLRVVESHVARRMHCGAGVRLERREGSLRERQPLRPGGIRRHDVAAGAGKQRVRVPGHRPGCGGVSSPHTARRAVPGGGPGPCGSRPIGRPRPRRAVSAPDRDQEDLSRDCSQRCHEGLRDGSDPRETAQERATDDRSDDVLGRDGPPRRRHSGIAEVTSAIAQLDDPTVRSLRFNDLARSCRGPCSGTRRAQPRADARRLRCRRPAPCLRSRRSRCSTRHRTQAGQPPATQTIQAALCHVRIEGRPAHELSGRHVGGVVLRRSFGSAACLLGRTWGYDQAGVWVSDGCSAEFVTGETVERKSTKPKPPQHIPNVGFLLFDGDKGQVYFRLFSYARYLNQRNLDETYVDALRQHADRGAAPGHPAAEVFRAVLRMVSHAEVSLLPVRLVVERVPG